ncbi:MAG: TIR domain-containing protein [Flavobacteriaceae bacterium]|nr:MAG: TIR domain-containing protein [Flavobacteriaceae bacterium]
MSNSKKIFISYSSRDKEFVDVLTKSLSLKNGISNDSFINIELLFDNKIVKDGDKIVPDLFYRRINQCDVFLLILSNNSMVSEWVKYEYVIELNKTINEEEKKVFIPILIEDLTNEVKSMVSVDIRKHKYADFRSPQSFLKQMDKLLKSIFITDEKISLKYKEKIQRLIYNLSIDPNIEVVRLKNIVQHALEENLIQHFKPMRRDVNMLRKLSQASERIMTLEAIAEAEKTANDSIWVISTHLNNDVYDKEIQESIKENLEKPIEYKYFVPDTKLIRTRIEEYTKIYQKANEQKNIEERFVFLDEYNTIMPFAEVVIYDPQDHMSIGGMYN